MQLTGMIQGLKHEYHDPIRYYLCVGEEKLPLNDHLGKQLSIRFAGKIECVFCGRKIKKTYNQGSCYVCFRDRAENDLCIVKPHLCHFEEGTCRDEQFGREMCHTSHYVYLALSSEVKVGITRKTNEMKRWVDQGAITALPVAELPDRKSAGELELILSEHLPDKTNWRKMLRGEYEAADLFQIREKVAQHIPDHFRPFLLNVDELVQFTYPLLEKLDKIKSYNLDKEGEVADQLIGAKGQYLLFTDGVINVRKYRGYYIEVSVES